MVLKHAFLAQGCAIKMPCQFYGISGDFVGFYLSRMSKNEQEQTIMSPLSYGLLAERRPSKLIVLAAYASRYGLGARRR
jgi:hypothetical protein